MSENSILEKEIETEQTPFDKKFEEAIQKPENLRSYQAIPVTLLQTHVEIELVSGQKKNISYDSFKDLMNRSVNHVEQAPVISGILPPSNMIFFSQSATQMHINVYHPGGNKEMLYHQDKLTIVAPNIIIGFTLRKEGADWIVSHANYFCTDLPLNKLPRTFINEVRHSAGIYDLPMSNTYGGGAMCYGGNSMPARFKDGNLRGLDWYYRYLWETPFNDDLGIRAVSNSIRVSTWYNALTKHAKANKVFPYVDLAGYRRLDGSPESESAIKRN